MNNIFLNLKFKLFSKEIKIHLFESNSRSDGAFGRCDILTNTISINTSIPIDNQKETLLHETIHLISDNLGLELTEKQTQGLSVGLYDFLIQNNIIN